MKIILWRSIEWTQIQKSSIYLKVDWNPFKILKWNAGVRSFRRANHFASVLVSRPWPKSVCRNLYEKLFSMCLGFVTIFCHHENKNAMIFFFNNIFAFFLKKENKYHLKWISWVNMINKKPERPISETVFEFLAKFRHNLKSFIYNRCNRFKFSVFVHVSNLNSPWGLNKNCVDPMIGSIGGLCTFFAILYVV